MKTLLVLRHAKAHSDSPSGSDFDRVLEPRGTSDAVAIGRMLRDRDRGFDAVLASPAARAVETLSGLLAGAGSAVEPDYDRRLYNAAPETLLEVIRAADERVARLLIVGHNPGLQELLLSLAGDDRDGLRGDVAASFGTATLAELWLSVERWSEVSRASGRIVSLVRPRDLDPAMTGLD